MDKNQFLFIVANKMFLMIIDKGRNTIINTNLELKQTDEYFPNDIWTDNRLVCQWISQGEEFGGSKV